MTEGFRPRHWSRSLAALSLALFATACTTCEVASLPPPPPPEPPPVVKVPKVKKLGFFRIGEPYQVKGVTYTPRMDWDYDREGHASWYGKPFHGRQTANGEVYDQNELTAAHQTLPLPSVVRVTNLENGRSLILRVNDRGPFIQGRIIDVSRRAAQLLKFHRKGTTRVRVEVLEKESRQAATEVGWKG